MENETSEQENIKRLAADPLYTLHAYKVACVKLGSIMCIFFVCRILSSLVSGFIATQFRGSDVLAYFLSYAAAVLLVYIVPLAFAVAITGSVRRYNGKLGELYRKPKRLARAFGTFPAMYGLGFGIALLTLLFSLLISHFTGGQTYIEDVLQPTVIEPPSSIAGALMLVFLLVVIAPLFEEFLVRGIIFDTLKPFGNGIAIVFSSILFGLMHGSLNMLLYTTALGLALGYVRYATGSLFAVTILHALINSVAAAFLFLSSLVGITNGENKLVNTLLSIYTLAWFVLIIAGLIVFIIKIPVIRKYKVENPWKDVGGGRKALMFFTSAPAIIMLVLAFNEHANNWLISLLL